MLIYGAPWWADMAATLGLYIAAFFATIGAAELSLRRRRRRVKTIK